MGKVQFLCNPQKQVILANASTPGWGTKRTKGTFFSLFDTQTLGRLSFTPTLTSLPSGTPLQLFTRIIQVNNSGICSLDLCSTQQQTNGSDSSPASEVCLAALHSGKGCQCKYERATSAAAHSHLKQPGSCLTFPAPPPPHPILPPSAECNGGTHFLLSDWHLLLSGFFFLYIICVCVRLLQLM